jgi:AAA domain-containing protein
MEEGDGTRLHIGQCEGRVWKIHGRPEPGRLFCPTRAGHRTLAVDLDQQGNLSAALGTDLNELKLTAHRLLMDDQAEINTFFLDPRPRLKLLPNTIDVEADDLLEAKTKLSSSTPPSPQGPSTS